MAKFSKRVRVTGDWIDSKSLRDGDIVKFTDEACVIPSQFLDDAGRPKDQTIAHILINDKSGTKSKNNPSGTLVMRLNQVTVEGLIDAFGDDSKKWIDKPLTVKKEKGVIGGRRVESVYLVPEGFSLVPDESEYLHIVPTPVESE